MRLRITWVIGGCALAAVAWTARPASEVRERALAALAEGDARGAAALLARELPGVADPTGRADLQCLRVQALRRAGDERGALSAFEDISTDAACWRRAAYEAADALLALGRAEEAADRYAELGAPSLGDGRDTQIVAAIVETAQKTSDPRGAELFGIALRARIPEDERLRIALAAVAWADAHGASPPGEAADVVGRALGRTDTPDLRRLYARLTGDVAVLAGLPDDAPTRRVRAQVALQRGDPWAAARWRALAADAGADVAVDQAFALAELRALAALPALDAVAADGGARSAEAAFVALDLAEGADAVARAEAWLARWPGDPRRVQVRERLDAARLAGARTAYAAGDFAGALAGYDRMTADGGERAAITAFEAGLAARAAGDTDGAARRWEALAAGWPYTEEAARATAALARMTAFDLKNPEKALADLTRLATEGREGAAAELARLEEADVTVAVPERVARPADAKVHLTTRNLAEVELRLHRIDVEAFLRQGGTLAGLESLDVAVIAPDARWTVDVPGYAQHADVGFDVDVPVDKPGLYAVTAAGPDREAHALLLVSDIDVVARAAGPDLVVAALRGGRPLPGARVVALDVTGAVEGRTGGDGLWRGAVEDVHGLAVVDRSGVALLDLAHTTGAVEIGWNITADLDRSVYRPGDRLGIRALVRQGGVPAAGAWAVRIRGEQGDLAEVTWTADARGVLSGELDVPPWPRGSEIAVIARSPAGDEVELASARVVPDGDPGRDLQISPDGAAWVARLEEADGRPAAGVALTWTDAAGVERVGRTDAGGRMRLDAPAAGIPWRPMVTVAGTGLAATAWVDADEPWIDGWIVQDRLRPGERGAVRLQGDAARVRVAVHRRLPVLEEVPPPPDPWVPTADEALRGPTAPTHRPDARATDEVWSADVAVAEGDVALPDLAAGDYDVVVTPTDGMGGSVWMELSISSEDPRITGLPWTARPGAEWRLGVEGGPALLTLESDRILAYALADRPGLARWTVDPAWGTGVTATATRADGRVHERFVAIDPELDVAVTAERVGETWEIRATVRDGAGRPVDAEVALTAIDTTIADAWGAPDALDREDAAARGAWRGTRDARVASAWYDAGYAQILSANLVAEAQRAQEARDARQALDSGILRSKTVVDLLAADIPMEAFGSIGASGYGSGGGSFGSRGEGKVGYASGRTSATASTPPGELGRVLWQVSRTDRAGVVVARITAPTRPTSWVISASALAGRAVGHGEARMERELASVVVDALRPGSPGELGRPSAVVMWDGDAPTRAQVAFGEDRREIELSARSAATVELPGLTPGETLRVVVGVDGREIARDLPFPLAPGVPVADGGGIANTGGPRALALADEPWLGASPGRAAVAGRAALLLGADLEGERRVRLAHAALLPGVGGTVEDRAQALVFLAGARERLDLPAAVVDDLAAGVLAGADTPSERVAAVWGLALAGVEPDEAAIGLLTSEADSLVDEDASRLARALVALDRADEARPLIRGAGVWATSARLALGERVPAPRGPYPVGDPRRPDWIAALMANGAPDAPLRTVMAAPGDSAAPPAGDHPVWVRRRLQSAAGRALPVLASAGRAISCGSPCRVQVGDRLEISLDPYALDTGGTGGLRWLPGEQLWRVDAPGAWVLRGSTWVDATQSREATAPVAIEATAADPGLEGVDPRVAVGRAAELAAAGADPEPWLGALAGWPEAARAASSLRFRHALRTDAAPAVVVRAFEELRVADPDAFLDLPTIERIARAYRAAGRAARAVDVWRAGLAAAFLAEAGVADQLGGVSGQVGVIQQTRAMLERYPSVPVVEDAAFHLAEQLGTLADSPLDETLVAAGVRPTDLRLQAAAWDREFLALHPDAELAPEAGFRLARTLLGLGAPDHAAEWADRVADAHPEHPVLDAVRYLQGLALAQTGDTAAALAIFRELSAGDWPLADGTRGPAPAAAEARLAAGRIHEARGDLEAAKDAYRASSGADAQGSLAALERVWLQPVEDTVLAGPGDALRVRVEAANLDEVSIRAYRVDLRTMFLRDGGLESVHAVEVAGVSPAWSGVRRIAAGPFPEERDIDLPMAGSGAWLVQLSADSWRATVLVVRSSLDLDVSDGPGGRRVTVRRGGRAAPGVQVRTVGSGTSAAATTDVRGVANVGSGAHVLAFDGEDYAFSPLDEPAAPASWSAPSPAFDPYSEVNRRLDAQRSKNQEVYQQDFKSNANGEVQADSL